MILKLGDSDIDLSGIDLRLGLNAVPRLSLRLKERRDAQLLKDVVGSSERATVSWEDKDLEILPYAFNDSSELGNDNEAYLHAALIEEALETWFTTKPDVSGELHYGVYQNQSDVGGWTFLNSSLGLNFLVPISDYQERINQVLPISTCLTRPIRQDNQQFLGTVIDYLQHHLPELVGWSAIHASEEPLRFIFFDEENAIKLDESWENLSARLPVRFAGHEHSSVDLRKTGMQVSAGQKMALMMELAKHGITEPLSGFLSYGEEKDLLYLPGPVKLGEKLFLCETITYSFEEEIDTLATTLELSSGFQTPAGTTVVTKLEGEFKAWDKDDSDEIRVFLSPPDDSLWQMMDAKDSNLLDPGSDLMAEFVLPTTPNDQFSGLYVRRVEGDRVVFELQPFHTPIIYGSQQILNEELEAATLSINTEILALSMSEKGTAIEDANGIVMDKDKMMSRAESDIFAESQTIILDNNVEITENSVDVKSKTDIANNVQIDGKLEVGGI